MGSIRKRPTVRKTSEIEMAEEAAVDARAEIANADQYAAVSHAVEAARQLRGRRVEPADNHHRAQAARPSFGEPKMKNAELSVVQFAARTVLTADDDVALGDLVEAIERRSVVLTYALESQVDKQQQDLDLLDALAGLAFENEEAIRAVDAILDRARALARPSTRDARRAKKGGA